MIDFLMLAFQEDEDLLQGDAPPVDDKKDGKKDSGKKG